MRHGDKNNNLGRTASHRRALLSNMTCSLIAHKRIITTLAKAKTLRIYAEPIITRSKVDNMHNRRVVFSYLQDKEAIKELFGTIGDKVANRPGGYTRIIKMPRRAGDAADMALIELVDFNELYSTSDKAGQKKTRRSRRGTGAAATEAPANVAGAGTPTAMDTDPRVTAEAVAAAHEAADADIAAEATETVIPTTDDSGEAIAPEAPAQKEGGESAGA
jgi:large subunit ribosomal protein L17